MGRLKCYEATQVPVAHVRYQSVFERQLSFSTVDNSKIIVEHYSRRGKGEVRAQQYNYHPQLHCVDR